MAPDQPHARSLSPPLLRHAHGILQATVDDDLPEPERAVGAMVEILAEDDQPVQDPSNESTPSEEELPGQEPPANPTP